MGHLQYILPEMQCLLHSNLLEFGNCYNVTISDMEIETQDSCLLVQYYFVNFCDCYFPFICYINSTLLGGSQEERTHKEYYNL